jgi:hypothetical protein
MTAAAAVAASVASVVACTTYVTDPYYANGGGEDASAFPGPGPEDASTGGFVEPPPSNVVFYGTPGIEFPDGSRPVPTDAGTDARFDGAATDSAATDGAATDGEAVDGAVPDGEPVDAATVDGADGE